MTQESPFIVYAKSPSSCSANDINCFKELVISGGEVTSGTLSALVSNALSLAFASRDGRIVAVGAIKRPNAGYRDVVFAKAKAIQNPSHFQYELGWVYVSLLSRGCNLSGALVAALLPSLGIEPAYATSRVDNIPMHATLEHSGFRPVGAPYPSKLNTPAIQLFLRD